MSTAIVWFRRDLRLRDNPALAAALRGHERVLPVYVHAPDEEAPWQPGAASRWWLHHSLDALGHDLRERGAPLYLARGKSESVLLRLAKAVGADTVYWNRLYEPACLARDRRVEKALQAKDIAVETFNAALLIEPWDIATTQDKPYKVFTPFWRKLRAQIEPTPVSLAPRQIAAPRIDGSLPLARLKLMPKKHWYAGIAEAWSPGEAGARDCLDHFLEHAVGDYQADRDVPSMEGTSRLSPHLHFGEISPRQIFWRIDERARKQAGSARLRTAAEPFLRQLGWRDFSFNLLVHFPRTAEENLNPQFDRFPWARKNADDLRRWQRGRTGIPIVDAGMRQLWHTGWMHNRVRMLVASFLTKNLRQHWLLGAQWFWHTLVDADLPNNTQGWQWVAGSGADASPYFRIFNPVTQGQRFDPDGDYVRRWVPELAKVDKKFVHAPWTKPGLLALCGYPEPMVDLPQSRDAALEAYKATK